ncbi:MAG: type IV pilus assembly protein PilM [Bacillota bacterium]
MPRNPLHKLTGVKYTAVDFGHHSLKAVHCKVRGDNVKVLKSGVETVPQGVIHNGQIDDLPTVSNKLEDLFQDAGIKPGIIIFSPAAGQEFVRRVQVPAMPYEELEEALHWEVQEYLNLPPERVASDFLILEEDNENFEILLALMPLHILDDYKEVFERIGYRARVANMQELGMVSLLNYQEKLDESSAIINIGANKTRILIANKDEFYLSRSVDIAGSSYTRIFKDEENSWEEADEAKKRSEFTPGIAEEEEGETDFEMVVSGFADENNHQTRMKDLTDELLVEINRSMEYYRERNPNQDLKKLYLTGGGSRLYGLKDYIGEQLGLEVENIDPYDSFKVKNHTSPGEEGRMAVASGLVASEVIHNEN